jgi:uncharacterized membrane protein
MLRKSLNTEITFTVGTLVLTSALCTAMLVVRALVYRNFGYWFLGWNLLLAWVPLLAAMAAAPLLRPGRRIWLALPVLVVWLLFLPNAPYLITDIFHWRRAASWQGWFELLMLVSFAWTGCMLGFASLRLVHQAVQQRLGALAGWGMVLCTSLATGFGVYLGRFVRFNSWDVATGSADEIVWTVFGLLWEPTRNALPLAFALTMGVFFLLGYLSLAVVPQRQAR